ncbi:MAG: type II secretion system F family protein [Candidatus Paceibacterota bacterium]
MQFRYSASDQEGKIIEKEIEAENLSAVLRFLTSRGLKPISVKPVKNTSKDINIFGGKITIDDQIFIFRYLSLMLKIGTNLLQAIDILIEDFDKSSVKNFLLETRSNLERGEPFYSTFKKYSNIFSSVHINLIKAGELSGNLEQVFSNITDSLIKEKALKDEMRNTLTYPVLLLGISILILIFLVTFALPRIANVFLESGFEPPGFSRIVFSVGLFFGEIWIWFLSAMIGLIFGIIYLYKKSNFFQKFVWSVLDSVPVIRDIIEKRALQRFAATTSSLVKAGIPINEALEITAEVTGHVGIKNALLNVSREGLAKGLTLGEAFKRETILPKTVTNLIAISEKAGHVENVLATLADFYIQEVDNSLKRLVSLMEPLLLLFIGVVIGVIALAIIVPIYQLTTQF